MIIQENSLPLLSILRKHMADSKMKYAIICIDDDPMILQMLNFQIRKRFDMECALLEFFTNPKEAIEEIETLLIERIDIIFLIVDYQMPEINGGELIRIVKNKFENLKFIMLSGQANSTSVNDLLESNLLDKFISKPWSEDTLVSAIKPLLDQFNISEI